MSHSVQAEDEYLNMWPDSNYKPQLILMNSSIFLQYSFAFLSEDLSFLFY